MGKPNFSEAFKRDAVAQITEREYPPAEARVGSGIDLAPVSPDGLKRLLTPMRDARAANAF